MMATQSNTSHPLPTAPGGGPQVQQYVHYQPDQRQTYQQPQAQHKASLSQASTGAGAGNSRPKSRTFSFKSDKSHRSSNSHTNINFGPETHAEKQAKRLHTKADPTMAISEIEPAALATTEKTQLTPLRSIAHRDSYGNPIAEPDVSNPTRSRWERPLDTIRSFEAAIDGGYHRKSSYQSNGDGESVANFSGSRRNSALNNLNNARYPQESYYGGRSQSQSYLPTSNSAYDLRQGLQGRGGGGHNDQAGYNNDGGRQRHHGQYINGGGRVGGEQNVYPMPSNHRSYETVTSGAGSGIIGEPAGYQTDPTSSDNSSIERNGSPSKQPQRYPHQPMNEYNPAFQGFNNGPQINLNSNSNYSGAYNGPNGPKPVPIQLSSTSAAAAAPYAQQQQQQQRPPQPPVAQRNSLLRKATKSGSPPDKKGWFKRFGKKD